ncbi:hypothetical protein K491DRAFT_248793 [Lophiostoma macrostomum CBS 122681]|uniref:Uncharacterized protein n=1 Tax=Lophiostoma macrostomum CBS 122681 TaxID=1314788 RepID=A0A6A6SN87_9PLEO|nr:hypothetical protein K491DRAFT_248793 [Lophiostoma macrostomum CBS 122681]
MALEWVGLRNGNIFAFWFVALFHGASLESLRCAQMKEASRACWHASIPSLQQQFVQQQFVLASRIGIFMYEERVFFEVYLSRHTHQNESESRRLYWSLLCSIILLTERITMWVQAC